jgi:type I restriction enzyme S subunit
MVLHIENVMAKTVQLEERLNPAYFRFINKRDELIKSSSLQFRKLGDKDIAFVTDGEHQMISLYEEDEPEAEVRYLYVHNIKEGIVDLNDSLYISRKDHERLKRSRLQAGYVLLTIVGTIGKAAEFYDYIPEANMPRNIAKIVVNNDKLFPEFLTTFFISQLGREQSFYCSGGNIQGLLSLTKLKSMYVPVPEKSKQNEIASMYKQALDMETEALDLIRKAREIFLHYLDIDFSKFKDKKFFQASLKELQDSNLWIPIYRFPKFLEIIDELRSKWKVMNIGKIFDKEKGFEVGSANYYDFVFRRSSYVPFVRTSDMVNFDVDHEPDYFVPSEIYEDLNQDIKNGDILFTNDGKIGEVSMVTESDKFVIQSHIRRLRVKDDVRLDPYYLFIPLTTKEITKYQCQKLTVVQSTIPTLSTRIDDIILPILDDGVMENIARLVRQAFHLKDQKKVLLKKVKKNMDDLLGYSGIA